MSRRSRCFGINAKQSQGTTFYADLSGTLSVTHENGVLCFVGREGCVGRASVTTCYDSKMPNIQELNEVSSTILATAYKEPPAIIERKRRRTTNAE